MFKKFSQYIGEVNAELQKASWPWIPKGKGEKGFKRFKELSDSTVVILIAMVLMGGFVSFWDLIMFNIIEMLTKFPRLGPLRTRFPTLEFQVNTMSIIPAPKDQWYVVHVLSGQEQKVRDNIERRIPLEEMGDLVFEVLVPTERVSEVKKGKKSETKRKFFPGYLIANMHLLTEDNKLVDRTWYFIRETAGVIGFAGTKDKPIPMRPKEVESMLQQIKERSDNVAPKFAFEVGETVKVSDGPFEGQTGTVEEINMEKGELLVAVNIFGRSTPVPLEYWQVEKA